MEALFIGQSYIDVTFIADRLPTGDEKDVARDYAVSFGGNAVTAAFCCAKLGIAPDLLTSLADDWLGHMFLDMAAKYHVSIHPRKVHRSSLSFVMPKDGKRAIVRCRDDDYLHPVSESQYQGLPRAASRRPSIRRRASITPSSAASRKSLPRSTAAPCATTRWSCSHFIDIAVVSERFCEQLKTSPQGALDVLKAKGCKIGGVTMGEHGLGLVRRKGHRAQYGGAARAERSRRRYQWRGRCVPRRLYLFLSRRSPKRSGKRISISRARRPRMRFNISATRRACRRPPIVKSTEKMFPAKEARALLGAR